MTVIIIALALFALLLAAVVRTSAATRAVLPSVWGGDASTRQSGADLAGERLDRVWPLGPLLVSARYSPRTPARISPLLAVPIPRSETASKQHG